jgi:hypothetical protein
MTFTRLGYMYRMLRIPVSWANLMRDASITDEGLSMIHIFSLCEVSEVVAMCGTEVVGLDLSQETHQKR